MNKLSEKELIERLTQLKDVKPDDNWVIFCRKNLVLQMKEKEEKQEIPIFDFSSAFWAFVRKISPPQFILKPVAAFVLIFGLIFGSGLIILVKANNSLPGDRIFPVKIALEQARLLATTSAEGKADFQSDITALRIDELNKIVNAEESMEQKKPKIEEAVINLQRHLLTLKDDLPKLDNSEAKRVVEVAKKIDANAATAEQALSHAKLALPLGSQNLTEKIAEAADEADKTGTKAFEMIVQKQGEAGVSQTEIVAKVDERIQKTEQMVKTFAQSVNNSAIADKLPINATIVLDESDEAIEQAKICLENNDITGALQAIKSASEMVKSAQKLVDNASPTQTTQQANPVLPNNATSSPGLVPITTSSPSSMLNLETEPISIYTSTLPVISVFGAGTNNE